MHQSRLNPHFVLLDVQLPGSDGFQLAAEIRKRAWGKRACLVMVTSYAMESDRERAYAAGLDGYLSKPIDTRVFVSQILTFFGGRAKAAAAN